MNGAFVICLVMAIGFGMEILRQRGITRADSYHLLHRPDSGCLECEDK